MNYQQTMWIVINLIHSFEFKLNLIVSANITSRKYRSWCRKNIKDYIEVFIDAEIKNLISRDYKKLYSRAIKKKLKNVVGINIPFKKPISSDIYITNNSTKSNFLKKIKIIKQYIKRKKIK